MTLRKKIMKKLCLSEEKKIEEIAQKIWKCIKDEFDNSKNQRNPCESITIQVKEKDNKLLVSVTIKEHCIEGIEFTELDKSILLENNKQFIPCIMSKVVKIASKKGIEVKFNRKTKSWIFHKNFLYKEF